MEFSNPRDEFEQTRHRLPHWRQGEVPVSVTFRLSDSLPQAIYEARLERREAPAKARLTSGYLYWEDRA